MKRIVLGKTGIEVNRLGFGGIPIQVILGIRYIIQRFGDATLQQKRIQEAIAKARQCSECGECMQRCPYELPIPELIKENIRWADEKSGR